LLAWSAFEFPIVNILKYYLLMLTYDVCFSTYGLIRIINAKSKENVFTPFDIFYWCAVKILVANMFFFIIIKFTNRMKDEISETEKVKT